MHIHLIAIGNKMPTWVTQAYNEYAQRMPPGCSLQLHELAAEKRTKNSPIAAICEKESLRLLQAVPDGARIVALDVTGKEWSTEQLAERLESWLMQGSDIALLVGGPDGLTRELVNKATERWSLSKLTFPHPLVRVIVAEQLYRAWTITQNHPYHRAG